MVVLITGGSGSGKSAYAEEYIHKLSADCRKYYIATMQVFDSEGRAKVERHRMLREGKGFITIEQPVSVGETLGKMAPGKGRTVLLECISNLTANEMFSGAKPESKDKVIEKVSEDVERLSRGLENLVIVTNNVFEDGFLYDETTTEYIRAMGEINERIADMADRVVEVVVGIPVVIKEGRKE